MGLVMQFAGHNNQRTQHNQPDTILILSPVSHLYEPVIPKLKILSLRLTEKHSGSSIRTSVSYSIKNNNKKTLASSTFICVQY